MTAYNVPPLATSYPDGRSYEREPDVEAELARLRQIPLDELVKRCSISSRGAAGYVSSEALVHMLRARQRDNRDARFNQLFTLLLRRVAKALPRSEHRDGGSVWEDSALGEANAAALGRFSTIVTLDRQGGAHLDFFEVHFDQAVARLRLSTRRRSERNRRREVSIDFDEDTGEPPASVERAAGSFDVPDDPIFSDPMFRPHLLMAIERLSAEQKEVVTMIVRNIPIESKDASKPSISAMLACDPRTVRNRRDRAVVRLRAMLTPGASS